MDQAEYERQRAEMWVQFARNQATEMMVVVEPSYYGLTDQRHVGSPEADNQDRLDREHEAMALIVTEAFEQYAESRGLSDKSIARRKYTPPMPPVGGAVGFYWEIYHLAQGIDWSSEFLKLAVLESIWRVPSYIYRTLHNRWKERNSSDDERNVPPISHAMVVAMCSYHASVVHTRLNPKPPDLPSPEDESPGLPGGIAIVYEVEVPTAKGVLIYTATNRMDVVSIIHKRFPWSRGTQLETASWYGLLSTT